MIIMYNVNVYVSLIIIKVIWHESPYSIIEIVSIFYEYRYNI